MILVIRVSQDISASDVCYFVTFFNLPAARVRVPGGAPFSQLQQREKDNSCSWKATKTLTIIGWPSKEPCKMEFQNFIRGRPSQDHKPGNLQYENFVTSRPSRKSLTCSQTLMKTKVTESQSPESYQNGSSASLKFQTSQFDPSLKDKFRELTK